MVMPGPVLTVTNPPFRLGVPTIRSGGETPIAATVIPLGICSWMPTSAPSAKGPGTTSQKPACTVMV
jgi:hypothetical protein